MLKRKESDYNETTSYWQKLVSGYKAMRTVIQASISNHTGMGDESNGFTEINIEEDQWIGFLVAIMIIVMMAVVDIGDNLWPICSYAWLAPW